MNKGRKTNDFVFDFPFEIFTLYVPQRYSCRQKSSSRSETPNSNAQMDQIRIEPKIKGCRILNETPKMDKSNLQ
jgi:hypothetical protein